MLSIEIYHVCEKKKKTSLKNVNEGGRALAWLFIVK